MSSDDGYDDVRVLLRDADPGPPPALDVEEILRSGARLRRRGTRDRWLAAAAAVLVLAGAGAAVAQLGRGGDASPADPAVASTSFVPTPTTAEQWLLYSQMAADRASSVHVVQQLRPDDPRMEATVDAVVGATSAQGTITSGNVTSRYVSVDGVTYVEPAVLVELGLVRASDVGAATWVRLGQQSRVQVPKSIGSSAYLADFARFSPETVESRLLDGRPATAIEVDLTEVVPPAKVQTYYIDQAAPYYPLLVTRDGRDLQRFSEWNAPVSTPVAPPAAEVVELPTL